MSEETRGQCPAHNEDSAGSDSYYFNTKTRVGHCKSCELATWEWKGNLYGKRDGKTFTIGPTGQEQKQEEEDLVEDFSTEQEPIKGGSYTSWRGVSSDTMEFFGVTTVGDKVVYPYPSGGSKERVKSEKKFFAKNMKADELFGMNLFPAGCSRKVTITEGEHDCLSAWQMLQSGKYLNPVVGLPGVSPSSKLWENSKKWLDSFDEIILSADNDAPGQKMAQRVSLMFPGKVKVMNHGSYKDANEFLMNGEAQAYKNAWWGAKTYRPDDIFIDAEDYLKLYDESPDFEYFPTGIEQLDDKILGINKGYFTVVQAPTGVGKSEFMRYLEYQCLKTSNYKFAYMHLEESRLRSVLGLVSYELGENVTLKKFVEDKGLDGLVREAITSMSLSERMIQFNYSPEEGYESLLDKIKYLVAAFGVDFVFFEPIQDLVNGEDKEGKLADLATRLGTMASELGVGIITIAHQNQNGDTMYATMIGKKAAFEILLVRDQETEDLTEKNRTYIKVGRKNRVGLGNGPAGAVDFDHQSYTLKPVMGPVEPKHKGDQDDF